MPISKACEHCATLFSVKASFAHQKYCSRKCMLEHEAAHGRPNAQVEMVDFSCRACSSTFSYKPSYLTAYHKKFGKDPLYCSTKCSGSAKRLTDDEWQIHCMQCGKPMPIHRKKGGTVNRQKRLCSTECRKILWRANWQTKHADAKPTRRTGRHGYIRMIIPGTNGGAPREILEHRYVMEQGLGRRLHPDETVHHKDGNRAHNEPGNLELFSSRHGPGQRVTDKVAFAIDMLRLYPEFARAAGVELRDVAQA